MRLTENSKITLTIGQLRRLVNEAFTPDVVDRIKAALEGLENIEFSKVVDYQDRTVVNINSPNCEKARKVLSSPQFANAIKAPVKSLTKTKAVGYTVSVDDPSHGKPVYMRIRSGGVYGRGMGNEQGLIGAIANAIEEGVTKIVFKDPEGGKFVVKDPISVRGTGTDAGSRMGNRGDLEIKDSRGGVHRISIKKNNASRIAGVTRYLAARRKKIQRALNDFIVANGSVISRTGNVSVQVHDPTFFRFCWFGLDINANGGVVIGNFENPGFSSIKGTTMTVNCLRAFSPNDDIDELITDDLTSMYLLMKIVNRRGHMVFFGSVNHAMGARYELPGFEIEGITIPSQTAMTTEDLEEADLLQ